MIYSNQKEAKNEQFKPLTGVYLSIKSGIIGFGIVAAFIILTKILAFAVNSAKNFNFDLNDLILSFWGFIILSFIVFAAENKNENKR